MKISLIAAYDTSRVIGYQQTLPWHFPEDLAYFKQKTLGNVVIMGRKTFNSIGFVLPKRINIVLSKQHLESNPDYLTSTSLEQALQLREVEQSEQVFIIGGESVFKTSLPFAQEVLVTHIRQSFSGDVYFPKLDPQLWYCKSSSMWQQSSSGIYFCFAQYVLRAY